MLASKTQHRYRTWCPIEKGQISSIKELLKPVRLWIRPSIVDMTEIDVFGNDSFHQTAVLFDVMAACPQHTFVTTTRNAERMVTFIKWLKDGHTNGMLWGTGESLLHLLRKGKVYRSIKNQERGWPPDNWWPGVNVSTEAELDVRMPYLQAVTEEIGRGGWLNMCPIVGEVDLREWLWCEECRGESPWGPGAVDDPQSNAMGGTPWRECGCRHGKVNAIAQVVIQGETGYRPRPCRLSWLRSITRQCRIASVPCYVRSTGTNLLDAAGVSVRIDPAEAENPKKWPDALEAREMAWETEKTLISAQPKAKPAPAPETKRARMVCTGVAWNVDKNQVGASFRPVQPPPKGVGWRITPDSAVCLLTQHPDQYNDYESGKEYFLTLSPVPEDNKTTKG